MTDQTAIDPDALDAEGISQLVDGLDAQAIDQLAKDISGETLAKLIEKAEPETAAKLVAKANVESLSQETMLKVVESLDGDGVTRLMQGLDGAAINKLVTAADTETARSLIRKVDPGTFDLTMIDAEGIDSSIFDADLVADVIRITPDEKLAEAMSGELRDVIVPEIFRRMPERFNAQAAQAVEAAIEFKVGRNGGEPDRGVIVIEKGSCRVADDFEGEPRVSVESGPVDFLKLVTGNANPVEMFMSGKLRIQGDLMFSAQIPALFRIPQPQAVA
jgi:putative sterol carrier protein